MTTRHSLCLVQVYFLPGEEGEPVRLAGYAGSRVEPGQTATVQESCDRRLFPCWDEAENSWKPPNDGELIIGRGLAMFAPACR